MKRLQFGILKFLVRSLKNATKNRMSNYKVLTWKQIMQLASIMKNHMETIPKYFQDIYRKIVSFLRYEHDYVVPD